MSERQALVSLLEEKKNDTKFKVKEAKSATMNIFHFFYFLFKSFVKVELNYASAINMFTIAENCREK